VGVTLYNPDDFYAEICEWIAQGKTLRDYCRQEGKPSYGTVYDWLEDNETFSSRFARARELGHDVIAEECLQIAEDGSNDWVETKFGPQLNSEHVQRSRLRVDTRLKLLAKWNPKKYGDKVEQFISGPDGAPMQAEITINLVKPPNGSS
jgi:hypothetical protein